MKIYIDRDNKKTTRKYTGKAGDLLKILKINPETVIIVRDNCVITEDDMINDSDEIKILSVVSGG